jgi:hypothetical protein
MRVPADVIVVRDFAGTHVGSPMMAVLGRLLKQEKTVTPSRGRFSPCERGAGISVCEQVQYEN